MRYKFFYSQQQKLGQEEQYVDWLRYQRMIGVYKPNLAYVKTTIEGEEFLIEFTEQFDSSKDYSHIGIDSATYSGVADAVLIYESDEKPVIVFRPFEVSVKEEY